jgi:hypothetical protein
VSVLVSYSIGSDLKMNSIRNLQIQALTIYVLVGDVVVVVVVAIVVVVVDFVMMRIHFELSFVVANLTALNLAPFYYSLVEYYLYYYYLTVAVVVVVLPN